MKSEQKSMERLNRGIAMVQEMKKAAFFQKNEKACELFEELCGILYEAQSDRLTLDTMAARLAAAHDDQTTVNSVHRLDIDYLCAEIGAASMLWRQVGTTRKLLARILWAILNRKAGGGARCRGLNPSVGPVRERNPMPNDPPIQIQLTDNQKSTLAINPIDKGHNPAQIDGTPQWQNSNPALIDLTVADDGKSAIASTKDGAGLGECDITCSADADLGEGVETLEQVWHLTVIGDKASSLNASFTPPEERN